MTESVIGFKVEFDTGDVVQKQSTVAKGFSDMGAAARQAADAFKTVQKSAVIDSSGFMAAMRGIAKDEERAGIAAKNLAAQWAQMGEAGAKAMRTIDFGNKMGEAAKASKKAEAERVAAAQQAAAKLEEIRKRELGDRIAGIQAYQAAQAKALAEEVAAAKRAAEEMRKAQWASLGAMGNTQLQKNSATGFGATINAYNADLAKKAAEEEAKAVKASADAIKRANEDKGKSFDFARLKLLAYVAVVLKSSKELITFADKYKELAARLKLVSGSTEELQRTQEQLYRSAQNNRAPLEETVRLYFRMSQGMRELGRTQAETVKMTDLVAKAMKISGASATETAAGLQQFSQAMQAGLLNGDEFRSVSENMPRVIKALSEYLGVSIGQLREMSAQGKITSQVLAEAVLAAGSSIEAEFKGIPLTVEGAFQQIKNASEKFIGDLDRITGGSDMLAKSLAGLAMVLDTVNAKMNEWFSSDIQSQIAAFNTRIAELKAEILELEKHPSILDRIFGTDIDQKRQQLVDMINAVMRLETTANASGDTFFNKIAETNKTFTDNLGKQTEAGKGVVAAAAKAAKEHTDIIQKIIAESIRQGYDPALALSVAFTESKFNPRAEGPDTGKGRGTAKGVFQMLDATAAGEGVANPSVNSFNPDMNIVAGIKYLVKNLAEFKGDKTLSVAAHNAGPGNIHKYGDKVPPPSFAKGQTYDYVQGITRGNGKNPGYDFWANLVGGGSLGDIDKVQKHFDDFHSQYMDQLKARQAAGDEAARTNIIRAEQEVKQIEGKMEEFNSKATIELKVAIDQKSYEEQIALINEQQAKNEELIRQRAAAAGGTDDGVRRAKEELKALEAEIASLEQNGGDQAAIDAKEIERTAAKTRVKNEEMKAQGANLTLQKELAENSRKYDEMRVEAGKRVVEVQKQQEEQAQRLGATTATAAKEIISSQVEQVKAQVAITAAQRETDLTNRQDLSTIEKQREALKGRLEDSIAVIEAEKNAAIQKAAIDTTVLQQEEAMLQARRASTELLKEQQQIEAQLADNALKQAAARKAATDAQIEAARAVAKAQVDTQDNNRELDLKQVKESQLEMNAFWDQYMSRLRDYADLWTEITGNTEDGWSKMTVALGDYSKQFAQIHQQFTDFNGQPTDMAKSWGDMAPMVEALQQGQAAAAMMAKTMLVARENTEKGSKAYDNLTTAAENFMALLQLLNVAEGISAILNQYKGDPYSAAFRAAAVAMQVASMGIATGFSGTGAEGTQINRSGADGGVFGGQADEVSRSISKSLELLASNSGADLQYSAEMVASLHNIEMALGGVTNQLIRNVGPKVTGNLGTLKTGNDIFAFGMKGFDPLADAIFSLVYNVSRKITSYGVQGVDQTLNSIIKQGFNGVSFTDIETKTKVFGLTVSKKLETVYAELENTVADQITKVFIGIADSLVKGAEAFNVAGEQVMGAIGNLNMNLGRLDMMNLSSEEIQKKVEEAFSKMSDSMAARLNKRLGLGLKEFIQAGEGMYETFIRIANSINVATGLLNEAGFKPIDYKDLTPAQKQANDTSGEIAKATIIAFEGVDTAMGYLVDLMVGSANDIMQAYKGLDSIRAAAAYAGFSFETLSTEMLAAGGGIQKFAENLRSYISNFKGEGSLFAVDLTKLRQSFDRLGVVMPKTKEEFTALVETQDQSTAAGRLLRVQLINLAGAFAAVADKAQQVTEAYSKYGTKDPLQSYKSQLDTVNEDFKAYADMISADFAANSKTMVKLPEYLQNVTAVEQAKTNLAASRTKKAGIIGGDGGIDDLDAQIADLVAKKNKTKAERQLLQELRKDRQVAGKELDAVSKDIKDYETQIKRLNAAIKKAYDNFNPEEMAALEAEKTKLLAEQGAAYLSTMSDVFDQITANLKAAQDTLKSIQDDILNLGGQITGGVQGRVDVATARSNTAQMAYESYQGDDIAILNDLATKYKNAIMEEYQAKLDLINDQKRAIEQERDAAQKKHDEEIAALEKQLGVAKELYDAVKNIQQYVKNLKLSQNSTLSPERKLAEAQARYQELLTKAQGGDAKAMQEITGASDAYLEAAKAFFGSSTNYSSIFDSIAAQLGELSNYNVEDAQTVQDKIDKLNADHEVYLKGIEEKLAALKIEEQIKALQEATVAKLQALEQSFAPAVDRAGETAKQQMADLIKYVLEQNVLNKDQLETLRAMAKNWGVEVPDSATPADPNPGDGTVPTPPEAPPKADESQYTEKQKREFRKRRTELQEKIDKANRNIAKWEKNGVKNEEQEKIDKAKANIKRWQEVMDSIPAFARGGFAKPGYAIVGEDGPEIVNFARPAQVYNASQTRDILSAPGDNRTFAALEAIKVEVAAMVAGQRAANPEIIAELRSLRMRVDDMERTQKLKKV